MEAKLIKLDVELFDDVPEITIDVRPKFNSIPTRSGKDTTNATWRDTYKVDVKHFFYGGVEHKLALDREAQELVDMFVSLEVSKWKEILKHAHSNNEIAIDNLNHELRIAKRSCWAKFKAWLS